MQNRIIKKTPADYRITEWSGGLTTELAIAPEESLYADRNFLWRVSSATVELERSDFTPLPDYRRLLMILDGELRIRHDGGAWKTLPALVSHSFDGASETVSEGKVIDFNLMLRKGKCEGAMLPLAPGSGGRRSLSEGFAASDAGLAGAPDELLIYCFDGELELLPENREAEEFTGGSSLSLSKGESLLISGIPGASWSVGGAAELRAAAAAVRYL